MKCPNCSGDNPGDARFCQHCGQPLEQRCLRCGTSNVADAAFCKQCGASLAAAPDRLGALRKSAPQALQDKIEAASATLAGERKPVTILFTDIVGSTALAEKLDPEEWKEIVSGAHQRVSEAVYRYEGTIAQLLGDGVLAFFGAPITHEDDPIRAVSAGLDIQRAILDYARGLKGYVDDFQMRIGVNTGTVVVGTVGSDMHMEYLAVGDAVNLAARLQSEAQPGRVLISEASARLVKAAFDLDARGDLHLKGKSQPVKVFEVVDRKAAPSSGRGIEGLVAPLVGRDRELAALKAGLHQCIDGHGQIVAVLGEAGIGKSRLVEETRLDPSFATLRWLEGRSLSYGQTLSFWTITQLINNDLGVSDGDPEVRIKAALRKRVATLFPGHLEDVLPYLGHLMGVSLEPEAAQRVTQLDGEALKRQVLWASTEYFNRVAQEQPTVLVIEDMHWADSSSLETMEGLLSLTDRAPLLVLLLGRIERDHGSWQLKLKAESDYAHRFTELQLKPLSPEDSNELVGKLLAVAALPESIRRLILERSEGNPFYLEEIIRSLIEQGAIVQDGPNWRATQHIASADIPESLQGVLLARIDRLQEDVRRTLQLASVIGKSFLYRLLEVIAAAERQLDEHLSQLQRADLVREKARRPELEYIFKHSLTQEAAYNSLLLERRKEFHRKVGAALEHLFADRQAEYYGLLAHHFDAAGENTKAVEYLIKAGDKSRLEEAYEEATRGYHRAIELLSEAGDVPQAARTWLKLGLIHQVNFEFEQAHQANETAFALERQLHTSEAAARTRRPRPQQPCRMTLCIPSGGRVTTLDPSKMTFASESWIASQVFAGLAELDADTNVVPHVARSWEVLDGGRRYVFHLRDDVRWTDGTPVTADDFEWTWKRFLAPSTASPLASMADDILGARDYREGRNQDSGSLGIRALDPLTLDVRLIAPVAYFIYFATLPGTYPLPRRVLERYGEDWWKPGHIVTNGAFRLTEFGHAHGVLERSWDYFGDFPGNLDQFEWQTVNGDAALVESYLSGRADYCMGLTQNEIPADVPAAERFEDKSLVTGILILLPDQPPLDDVRIRRAIVHATDREHLASTIGARHPATHGGVLPPGLAGHSPELGLEFNPARARQLLAEAGYPAERKLPVLKWYFPQETPQALKAAFLQQMLEHLGLRLDLVPISTDVVWTTITDSNLQGGAWMADYPDPDNFLRQSFMYRLLERRGWRHPRLEQLLEEAPRVADRARRLAMYREADRILVNDEAVIMPWLYSSPLDMSLRKPWIKGLKVNAMGLTSLREVTVEPH
jgi:ABC-type oligopeptide transport system substrate-binding subunit/class 3 adenylate cyclase/type II secretory pathway predicted ATPase ExeA